ncbi:MAG: VOC family protein, partial [Candidatus Sulfotelmatobacter sp.]
VFSYGKPPFYAQVGRDAARLNLKCVERPVIESMVRDREVLLSASMTVGTADEIKLLFLEFRSAGVAFHQTLKKQPWGAKNFVVKDPDGNLLLFAGPALLSRKALSSSTFMPVYPGAPKSPNHSPTTD